MPQLTLGPDAAHDLVGDLRVDAALAALDAVPAAKAVGPERPFVQAHPAFADGVDDALVGSRDEAVDRRSEIARARAASPERVSATRRRTPGPGASAPARATPR